MNSLSRRRFMGVVAVASFGAKALQAAQAPIIDSHIHLFDRNDPNGNFWPPKEDTVFQGVDSFLPPRYREMVRPYGIVGAIAIETTPMVEYNQWMLDVVAKNPIMLGYVGFLDPGLPGFGKNLERFHKNKFLLGLRYGNRNKRPNGDIGDEINNNPEFVSNLRLLADAGLSLDAGAPAPDVSVLLRVSDKVPSLRFVVPHLANAKIPEDRAGLDTYMAQIREFAKRPHVFWKITQFAKKRADGTVDTDLSRYRDRLDGLFDAFGEDRTLFGTDWPNMAHTAGIGGFSDVISIVTEYINSKSPKVAEKIYWRNSVAAYRWTPRDPSQPKA